MKVFILTDLEGVSGVNGRSDNVGNRIINEEQSRRLLTEEVNAAVAGLVQGGASEIVVYDGHGGGNSINIENLHPMAKLYVQVADGLSPIIGLDSSFDAALHIGAHAMIGVPDGFLSHTYNSHSIVNMWLNDVPVGEIGMAALLCGYFGVPTILVSGDRAACREAREFLGKVETVETKTALSRYSVINRNPAEARKELCEKAKKALMNEADFPVKTVNPPYALKIRFMCPNMADASEMRGASRLDQQTVGFESQDLIDLWAQRNGWAPGVHNPKFKISPSGY